MLYFLIDFLSCGDVSARTPCASGNSSLNGEWVVEDVVSDGQEYRRLVFLSSSHIAYIDGIELDPDIVKVAVQWFDLPEKDPRMNINVIDALFYLEHAAQEKEREKLDVLFVDLAGPVHESGLSCPPAIFLTGPVLSNMKSSLKKDGMFFLSQF
uniref:PABS domain-containing protein n=1 Tax=Angiostrongylus cantonensis TaxID=6313 RepID=A0A158PBK0_ANGCA